MKNNLTFDELGKRFNIYFDETQKVEGLSPVASVERIENGVKIVITDKNGQTTAEVYDGENGGEGYTPKKGIDYFTAEDIKSLGIDKKVDKVYGKGLSSNDFTDTNKEKLNALPTKIENDTAYASKDELNTLATKDNYDFDETYIITEEEATATKWARTVDSQGNPIRLTEMQVDFTIPAGENTGVQYLYFSYGDSSENVKHMRVTEFAYQHLSRDRHIRALCYKPQNTYLLAGYAWNYDDNYTALQTTMGHRMGVGTFFDTVEDTDGIADFRGCYFNVANGMPVAGTVVRIRGKKYNVS